MNFLSKLGLTKLVNNIKNELNNKQDKLTTGNGIKITDENVIKTTSSLKGKKITVIGDSLSAGSTIETNWVIELGKNTGATVVNLAQDGATIAYRDNDNGNNFVSKMRYVPTDSDYVVIMGGGNDMFQGIGVGNRKEVNNTHLVSGAVFQIIAYLQTNLPNAKIMFITEPPIGSELHELYTPYLNIIMEMCAYTHIPCFNMTNNFGLNPAIPEVREIYWLEDYVHLTVEGQKYMSSKIQKFLETEVVNNNENARSVNGYKLVVLTQSEYDALTTKDSKTIYIIKDESEITEGLIDENLWNTFFKITEYNGTSVTNNNPSLTFSGTTTGALIANLSEENATYDYGATISHVATTLDVGKTLSIEVELETTNVSVCSMAFVYGTGSYADLIATNGQSGTYTVSISNTTDSTININGIACVIDVADTTGYSLKMTIKSITIS